jgi:hypothetical protein
MNIQQPTQHVAGSSRDIFLEFRHEGDASFLTEAQGGEGFHWDRVVVQHLQNSGFHAQPI